MLLTTAAELRYHRHPSSHLPAASDDSDHIDPCLPLAFHHRLLSVHRWGQPVPDDSGRAHDRDTKSCTAGEADCGAGESIVNILPVSEFTHAASAFAHFWMMIWM